MKVVPARGLPDATIPKNHLSFEDRVLVETGLWNELNEAYNEAFDELYKLTKKHDIFRRS